MPVINISPLRVEGAQKNDADYSEFDIPSSDNLALEDAPIARNVAHIYRLMANDLQNGTRSAPGIEAAVSLHRTLSAIEESASTGRRVSVG